MVESWGECYTLISPLFYSLYRSCGAMGMIPLLPPCMRHRLPKNRTGYPPKTQPSHSGTQSCFLSPEKPLHKQYPIYHNAEICRTRAELARQAARSTRTPVEGARGESFPPKSCSPYGVRGAAPILLRLRKDSDCGVEQEVVAVNDFRVMGISEDSCDFETFQPSDSCEVIRAVV